MPLRIVFGSPTRASNAPSRPTRTCTVYELPLISAKSNTSSWTATREQSTGLAAIHVRSQLIGIHAAPPEEYD